MKSPLIRRAGRVLLLAASLLSTPAGAAAQHSVGEQTFFAFDDHCIPWRHNLKLTLVEAEKHPGNPVLRRGPEDAPDHGHSILYGTVIKDGDKFRMWYLGMFETGLKAGQAPGSIYQRRLRLFLLLISLKVLKVQM